MITKSEKTTHYIIETVAPLFNKKGYSGTSMSDITTATGLTKGAIYGNFKNKEELALAAFNHNVKKIINQIATIINTIDSPIAKLFAITHFYRNYYQFNHDLGGCPILNVGIDTKHIHPALYDRVKEIIQLLKSHISEIIREGKSRGEIKMNISPDNYGGRIFSLIEGAVFTSVMLNNDTYLKDMMNHLDTMIKTEIQK